MEFNPQIQLAGLLEWMAEQMNACHGKTAVITHAGRGPDGRAEKLTEGLVPQAHAQHLMRV